MVCSFVHLLGSYLFCDAFSCAFLSVKPMLVTIIVLAIPQILNQLQEKDKPYSCIIHMKSQAVWELKMGGKHTGRAGHLKST